MVISFAGMTFLYVRSLLFWDVTQHRLEVSDVSGQSISAIFRIKQSKNILELKIGMTGCPTMSVIKYKSMLRNNPEEPGPHLHHNGGIKFFLCA
jgi:hypothetical protein